MNYKEALFNLNHIYGMVSPDIQRSLDIAIKALEDKPQGKWIWITEPDGFIHAKCSTCNQFNDRGDVAFCPWCGADMRGEEE